MCFLPIEDKYCREAVNDGRADFIPISASEMPLLYRHKHVNLDYALISVTPPDKHGFCSLGTFVGTARSAIQSAKTIIGMLNISLIYFVLLSSSKPNATGDLR